MNAGNESLPSDTTALLRRILNAVEPAKRKPWFEMACAIVLALATTASAWCAYQSRLAAEAMAAARQARGFSDDYVLLTVVFASVLFFGGIARAFDSCPLRTVLAALAVLLFVGTWVAITTLPICHE